MLLETVTSVNSHFSMKRKQKTLIKKKEIDRNHLQYKGLINNREIESIDL